MKKWQKRRAAWKGVWQQRVVKVAQRDTPGSRQAEWCLGVRESGGEVQAVCCCSEMFKVCAVGRGGREKVVVYVSTYMLRLQWQQQRRVCSSSRRRVQQMLQKESMKNRKERKEKEKRRG